MYTTYRLKTSDLNIEFIESPKALFRDQEVEIAVSPVNPTAYLLQSEANRERLLAAITNIESGRSLAEVPKDMLQ
jgi:antitoxin YefM